MGFDTITVTVMAAHARVGCPGMGSCPTPGKACWAREVAAHLAGREHPAEHMHMERRGAIAGVQ